MSNAFHWFIANTSLDRIFLCLGIVGLIELIALSPRRFRWKNTAFNYLYIVTTMTVEIAVRWVIVLVAGQASMLIGGPFIDLTIPRHNMVLTQIGAMLSFLLVFDLFYYWHHRMSHKFPVLWQTHKLHHAQEYLNGSSAFVNHWSDDLLRAITIYAPMGMLFKFEPVTLWWFGLAITFHVIFTHVDINIPLGPLTPIINGPQLHRMHHTNQADKIDKNFAFYFPIWDVVFRTYLKPARDEHTTTGLVSGEKITGLWNFHMHPFVGWSRMALTRATKRRQPLIFGRDEDEGGLKEAGTGGAG